MRGVTGYSGRSGNSQEAAAARLQAGRPAPPDNRQTRRAAARELQRLDRLAREQARP